MADDRQVRLQLSRWVKSGQLIQFRRGLYALAPPWRKVEPHPFLIANRMRSGSYVSLQSALAWHGAIPEKVPVVTSVGPGRPEKASTPLGVFQIQHLAESLRFGFSRVEVAPRQFAFVAAPEKALLDLVHLTPAGDSEECLRELRLQNPAAFQHATLEDLARRSGKPKRTSALSSSEIAILSLYRSRRSRHCWSPREGQPYFTASPAAFHADAVAGLSGGVLLLFRLSKQQSRSACCTEGGNGGTL